MQHDTSSSNLLKFLSRTHSVGTCSRFEELGSAALGGTYTGVANEGVDTFFKPLFSLL
jgi:hypothetical protein